jgi:hypothetical protein
MKVEGYVQALFIKTGTNSRGPWAAHSIKLANADGTENPTFFGFGFKRPPFQADVVIQDKQKVAEGEGSYVRFEATVKDEKNAEYVDGSGQIVKNAPARTKATYQKKGTGQGGGGRGGYQKREPTKSALFGSIGGYDTEDDIARITFTAARRDATDIARLLVEVKGLPLTGASTKAGEAKRYDEVLAVINKLTTQFFYDAANPKRVLGNNEDAGAVAASPKANGELPDDVNGDREEFAETTEASDAPAGEWEDAEPSVEGHEPGEWSEG